MTQQASTATAPSTPKAIGPPTACEAPVIVGLCCFVRHATEHHQHTEQPAQADAYRMLLSSLDPGSYPSAPSHSWTVLLTQGHAVPVRGTACTVAPDPICSLVLPASPLVFLLSWLRTSAHSLTYKFRLPSLVPVVPHRSFLHPPDHSFAYNLRFLIIYIFRQLAAPWKKVLQQFDLVTEGGP